MYKHKIVTEKQFKVAIPWLTVVEIEVNTHCNRKCGYCPNSILDQSSSQQLMPDEVFGRILDELERIHFDGRISYHFYNEPLLRSDIEDLIGQSSQRLSGVYQVLFTNGDLLSQERYDRLIAAGVDHFIVTRHGNVSIPERPFQTVQFPGELQLTNRGGTMAQLSEGLDKPLALPCYVPSEMVVITHNGDIVQCYEDARRSQIMGNIMEQSIDDIWLSDCFSRLRKLLQDGRRLEAGRLCRVCNNRAHTQPGTCYSAL